MAECHVNRQDMLRYLGYDGQFLSDELEERIQAMIERCESMSRPRWMWRKFRVDASSGEVHLAGSGLTLPGESIYRHVGKAAVCAIMACTLGLVNERELQKLNAMEPTDAVLFSAAGSSLVESAANACEAEIVADAASRGLRTNWRFSPGYGDFSLSVQPAFLRTLGADRSLGIAVTSSNLLIPAKSITAVVGMFDGPHETLKRSCAGCNCHDHCSLRMQGVPCWQ